MRWKIYCKPNKILWRKLNKNSAECKSIILKTTYPVALKRIRDWCKMVLAKVENYLTKIKEIDFIVININIIILESRKNAYRKRNRLIIYVTYYFNQIFIDKSTNLLYK